MARLLRIATVFLWSAAPAFGQAADPALVARARALFGAAPLIDTHNDLPSMLLDAHKGDLTRVDLGKIQPALCADVPRLAEGGIGAQYWSVFVESSTMATHTALHEALREFDVTLRFIRSQPRLDSVVDRHPAHGPFVAATRRRPGTRLPGPAPSER